MRKIRALIFILIFLLITFPVASGAYPNISASLKNRYHIEFSIFLNITASGKYDVNEDGTLDENETQTLIFVTLYPLFPEFFESSEAYGNYLYFQSFLVDHKPSWILLNTTSLNVEPKQSISVNSTLLATLSFMVEFYFNGTWHHTLELKKNWSGSLSFHLPDGWSYISSSLKDVKLENNMVEGVFEKGFILKLREDKYYWMSWEVYSLLGIIFGAFVYISYKRRHVKRRIVNLVAGSLVRNLIALFITLTIIFYFLWVLGPSLEARVAGLAPISSRLFLVKLYNLDKPWYVQFYHWWESVFTGKLLTSLNWDQKFSLGDLKEGMIKSAYIFSISTFLSYFVSTYLGTFSGKKRDLDLPAIIFLVLYSIPTFIAALLFLRLSQLNNSFYIFLVTPFQNGLEYLRLIFPAFILSFLTIAKPYLLTKNVAIREYRAPYVFTFKAVGAEKKKIRKLVRRTSLIPIITDSVLNFGWILTAQLFVEVIFKIKGMGYVLFVGTTKGNPFEVQLALVYLAFVMIMGSILADTLLFALDPRVRK